MITRKEYMNGDCTHSEYYAQFVNESVKDTVVKYIGLDVLRASTDEHLNDIPLQSWDNLPLYAYLGEQFRACGDFPTMAGAVCLYKTAAKQIKAELS
jgi:hypothetical protein